jgi:hypothetical protein
MRLQNVIELVVPAVLLKLVKKDKTTCTALLLILSADICSYLTPVLTIGTKRAHETLGVLF